MLNPQVALNSVACSVRFFVMVLGILLLPGCTDPAPDPVANRIIDHVTVSSPDGSIEARVYEIVGDENAALTQLMLSFKNSGCGSGAVSWYENDLDVSLRWIDDQTLEVRYPGVVEAARNPSGEVITCLDQKVRVLLKPQ